MDHADHNSTSGSSPTIQCLPEVVVETILGWLSYDEVAHAAEVCQLFRNAASTVLRTAMRKLIPEIEAQMAILEQEATALHGKDSTAKQLHIALLHSVLRVLLADARMVRAVCWRYMRHCIDGFCFPAGDILDQFKHVLELVQDREINKDLEPEVTSGLFLRIEKFIDLFDSTIEPLLLRQNATPYGVKILDILDCCQSSDYHISVTHGQSLKPFSMSAVYELRDVSTIDNPPPLTSDMTADHKLKIVCRYLRNNVRWNNLFHPLKELWDLEDAVEQQGANLISGSLLHHHDLHKRMMEVLIPPTPVYKTRGVCTHNKEVINIKGNPMRRDDFKRELIHFNNRLGLTCEIQLHGRSKQELPLELEFLNDIALEDESSESIHHHHHPSNSDPIDTNANSLGSLEEVVDQITSPLSNQPTSPNDGNISPVVNETSVDTVSKMFFDSKGNATTTGLDWLDNPKGPEDQHGYHFTLNLRVLYPSHSCTNFLKETLIVLEHSDSRASVSSHIDMLPP